MHCDCNGRRYHYIVHLVVLRAPLSQLVLVGLAAAAVVDEVVRFVVAAIFNLTSPVPKRVGEGACTRTIGAILRTASCACTLIAIIALALLQQALVIVIYLVPAVLGLQMWLILG